MNKTKYIWNSSLGPVHKNPDVFETQQFFHPDSYGRCLKPLWRIVSNRRGFIKWIHSVSGFNCVDAKKLKNTVRGFKNRAIFVWPWKIVSVGVRYLFYRPMDEKIKTCWTLRFPAKENYPNIDWRHCSIGHSCCSMTSKRSIGWFLESSWAWSFFTRAFA